MSESAGSPLQPGVVDRETAMTMSGLDLLRGWLEGRLPPASAGSEDWGASPGNSGAISHGASSRSPVSCSARSRSN